MAKTRWGLILLGLILVGGAMFALSVQTGKLTVIQDYNLLYTQNEAHIECTVVKFGQSVSVSVPKDGSNLQSKGYSPKNKVYISSVDGYNSGIGNYLVYYRVCPQANPSCTSDTKIIPTANTLLTELEAGQVLVVHAERAVFETVGIYKVPMVLKFEYDQYGLRKVAGNNRLDISYTGCTVASLNRDALPNPCVGPGCNADGSYPQLISFDSYINYIDGWNLAFSDGNTYQYNSKEIYIEGKGKYYPVTLQKMANGYTVKMVDLTKPVLDANIECKPLVEPACGADFKLKTQVAGNACDKFGNIQGKTYDVSGAFPNEWVEYGCVNGLWQITNHGKIQCDNRKPCDAGYVCGSDFTCLKSESLNPPQKEEQTPFDKLLVASSLFGLVAALLVFLNSKKKNSERAIVAGLSLAVGALVALAVYAVGSYLLNLPTWAVLLGVAGAGVGLYLVGGALFTILLALVLRR